MFHIGFFSCTFCDFLNFWCLKSICLRSIIMYLKNKQRYTHYTKNGPRHLERKLLFGNNWRKEIIPKRQSLLFRVSIQTWDFKHWIVPLIGVITVCTKQNNALVWGTAVSDFLSRVPTRIFLTQVIGFSTDSTRPDHVITQLAQEYSTNST